MHPVAWIAWALTAGIAVMSTTNPFYLLPMVAGAWAIHAAHRREGPEARSFRFFLVFGALTICTRTLLVLLGPVTEGSVAAAFFEGLRLAVLLIVFGAFNSVADPFGILKLAPRRFHEPALAAALAVSIAPRTIAAAQRVREGQRLRGIKINGLRALPALAVPVLETGMEEAVMLAESMDARGHGRGQRTRYRPQSWDGPSLWTVACVVVGGAIFLTALLRHDPSLTTSTFPLIWPEVDPLLLAAVLAFAAPAFFPKGRGA